MPKNSDRPGELILENGHLLLIFFAIVALSGVFFALGYIVGRNTFSPSAATALAEVDGVEAAAKPSPMPPAAYYLRQGPPVAAVEEEPAFLEPELQFDRTLGAQAPEARLESPEPASLPDVFPPQPSLPNEPREPREPNLPRVPNAPGVIGPPPPGILVQVSAMTRHQDAEMLLQLLREKNLPVLVTTGTGDSLYHVVIGPYQSDAEAQQVKRSLEEDGFQPIIKR